MSEETNISLIHIKDWKDPNLKDGLYKFKDIKDSLDPKAFKSEKDMCVFIERNIRLFCEDLLGVEYKTHQREYPLYGKHRHKGSRRLDFLITTKCGKQIALECKTPKLTCDLQSAIGQSLNYLTIAGCTGLIINQLVIVSSKVDNIVPLTINRFNLPISFIALDTKRCLILQKNYDGRGE